MIDTSSWTIGVNFTEARRVAEYIEYNHREWFTGAGLPVPSNPLTADRYTREQYLIGLLNDVYFLIEEREPTAAYNYLPTWAADWYVRTSLLEPC